MHLINHSDMKRIKFNLTKKQNEEFNIFRNTYDILNGINRMRGNFGISARKVELMPPPILAFPKNPCIIFSKSVLMMSQRTLKKCIVKPSGLGALSESIAQITLMISSSDTGFNKA